MQQEQQEQHKQQNMRFWSVLLIITAALAFIYFFVIPFLGSVGRSIGGSANPGGWSDVYQRQVAFQLAQNVQDYRSQKREPRRINYGDAYIEAISDSTTSFRPQIPYDGMDSPTSPINSTHSEAKLKGWALATIRSKLQNLSAGATINVLIFTQVKVCTPCRNGVKRKDAQAWATQLQLVAPKGVTVNLYIWQQTNFDIDHPDQTLVESEDDVESAVLASAP